MLESLWVSLRGLVRSAPPAHRADCVAAGAARSRPGAPRGRYGAVERDLNAALDALTARPPSEHNA